MSASRVTGAFQKFSGFRARTPSIPSKWKGGRMEKIADHLKMVLEDYKAVGAETKQDIKNRPFKTLFYLTGLGGIVGLCKMNPDERVFMEELIQNTNELMLVGDAIRNPESDDFMQNILKYHNQGRLKRLSIGICSFMYYSDHADETDLYETQCDHVKPKYKDFKDRILDIGIIGHWMALHNMMKDYDINPKEWENEKGKST
ncbi:mitochondrial import inner membrane translocase subunit Tim29-like [Lineus longissimus]|uniref:mitochondrial import inner membrane translocase subunit Tim29-like n=1 Tax=Lineus longissimus TaxID=88925 RepID=UPI002B4DA700